jgi:hypothetical protein
MATDTRTSGSPTDSLPPGFEHEGIYCFRGVDGNFQCIPGAPVAQKTARGGPAVSLIAMGSVSMLQLSVQWDISAAQVASLAARIAKDSPQLDAGAVQIVSAPVTVDAVDLTLDQGQGSIAVLQSARSSGYRPFAAIFSLPLSDAQNAAVMAALKGRSGVLAVTYHVCASVERSAALTLTGDLTSCIEQLRQAGDLSLARQFITQAIGEGRLVVARSGNADPTSQLWRDAERELEDKATDALQRVVSERVSFDRSALKIEVTRTAPLRIPLQRSADVSSWFAHGAADPIQVIPSGS